MRTSSEIMAEINALKISLTTTTKKFNEVGQIIGDGNLCSQDATNLFQIFDDILSYIGEANNCFSTLSGEKIEQFKFKTTHLNEVFENTNSQVGVLISSLSEALEALLNLQRKLQEEITSIKNQIQILEREYNSAFMLEKVTKPSN